MSVKVCTLAIAPLTWVRLVTSSALQSRKWQLIGISQWCRSALCGHPLPALTDNWTHGAASRHTIAPISHTRPSSRSRSYYSFPVPLRVGGWVGLCIHKMSVLIVIGLQRRCNWSSNRLQQRRSPVVDVQRVSVLKEPVGRTDAYNPRRNHIAPIMASVIACRRPTVPALCSLIWPTGDQHLLGLWHYAEYANAAVARVTLHTYRHTSMCS